jgi:ribosome modulation factor
MKTIPKVITNLERAIAFMEGIQAFDEGTRRDHNPYTGRSDELMQAWWNGWDQAYEEENVR